MVDGPLFGIFPEDTISVGYYFFIVCLCALAHTPRSLRTLGRASD